jgi:hypothetical protein
MTVILISRAMRNCLSIAILVFLASHFLGSTAVADSLAVSWKVIASGGRQATSGSAQLSGSMGQLATTDISSTNLKLYQGFWQNLTQWFPCGDVNRSGFVDVDDVIFIVTYIFGAGEAPDPKLGNTNCAEAVDIDDIIYLITYIFGAGPIPCADCL